MSTVIHGCNLKLQIEGMPSNEKLEYIVQHSTRQDFASISYAHNCCVTDTKYWLSQSKGYCSIQHTANHGHPDCSQKTALDTLQLYTCILYMKSGILSKKNREASVLAEL